VGTDGHKISFSLGVWFSSDELKDWHEGIFLIWLVLNERLAVEGENYLQGGKGPVRRRQVRDDSMRFPKQRGVSNSKSSSGTGVEARQPKITLFALLWKTSKSFFSVSQRKGNHEWTGRHMKGRVRWMLCTVLEEGLFGGTPRCRGYGEECFELRVELCSLWNERRSGHVSQGESSVKSHTE